MSWSNEELRQIRLLLAVRFEERDDQRRVVADADLNSSMMGFKDRADLSWFNILTEANQHNNGVERIIKAAMKVYEGDAELKSILDHNIYYTTQVSRETLDIEVDGRQLEKLMNPAVSTLVDVSFLEIGLTRARAVGKVENELRRSNGSGFMIEGGWLITNHHVVATPEEAVSARLVLNYQLTVDNNPMPPRYYQLDPNNSGFHTSEKNDWTAIRIKGPLDDGESTIRLAPVSVAIKDRVNVIQHPGGSYKKIAWNASPVVAIGKGRIQYTTDTDEGSSGSPVFDRHWNVVAVHHAGGNLKLIGSTRDYYCNQGIDINVVIDELRRVGVLEP